MGALYGYNFTTLLSVLPTLTALMYLYPVWNISRHPIWRWPEYHITRLPGSTLSGRVHIRFVCKYRLICASTLTHRRLQGSGRPVIGRRIPDLPEGRRERVIYLHCNLIQSKSHNSARSYRVLFVVVRWKIDLRQGSLRTEREVGSQT